MSPIKLSGCCTYWVLYLLLPGLSLGAHLRLHWPTDLMNKSQIELHWQIPNWATLTVYQFDEQIPHWATELPRIVSKYNTVINKSLQKSSSYIFLKHCCPSFVTFYFTWGPWWFHRICRWKSYKLPSWNDSFNIWHLKPLFRNAIKINQLNTNFCNTALKIIASSRLKNEIVNSALLLLCCLCSWNVRGQVAGKSPFLAQLWFL